jgi:hypothetical protein
MGIREVNKMYKELIKMENKKIIAGLKEIKKGTTNKLTKKVINMLLSHQNDYENLQSYIEDILQHGCISGMISELIYYNDTIAFYKKYKREIMEMLQESLLECGYKSPSEIFGNKWDNDDYFIKDTQNQNLLAWYGFEETVYKLANQLELNV